MLHAEFEGQPLLTKVSERASYSDRRDSGTPGQVPQCGDSGQTGGPEEVAIDTEVVADGEVRLISTLVWSSRRAALLLMSQRRQYSSSSTLTLIRSLVAMPTDL